MADDDDDIEKWSLERCDNWLNHPYNQPCRTDDTFDRAFRSEVKKRYYLLTDISTEKKLKITFTKT